MPKYEGHIDKDIWGRDRVVVHQRMSGEDFLDAGFGLTGAAIQGVRNRLANAKAQGAARQLEAAMQAAEQGNYQAALDTINDVIRKFPYEPESYYLRAAVNLGRANRAWQADRDAERDTYAQAVIVDADNLLKMVGDDHDIYWMRARAHMLTQAYDRAIADANMCTRMDPNDAGGYLVKAHLFLELDDTEQAMFSAQRALQLEPSSEAYMARGTVYHKMGDLPKALSDFNRAVALDPSDSTVKSWRDGVTREMKEQEASQSPPTTAESTASAPDAGVENSSAPVSPKPAAAPRAVPAVAAQPARIAQPAPKRTTYALPPPMPMPAPQTSGMAIGALVCMFIIPFIAPILGIIALREISNSGGRKKGTGLAVIAIVVPVIFLIIALSR